MIQTGSDDTPVSKNDVKPGDMLLYVMQEKPQFKEWTKENLPANFAALVDMLIIFSENSMCTHAALAASEPDSVVESTMPYIRWRTPIYCEGYHTAVRRVSGNNDGSVVLTYLPPYSKDTPKDNAPYAYSQAVLAALICMFKRTLPDDPVVRESILLFLKLLLYPLASWLDSIIPTIQGKPAAYFCSQLVADCYSEAAVHNSPAFRLRCPDSGPVGDTLIDWLLKQDPDLSAAPENGTFAERTLETPEIMCAALSLLEKLQPENSSVFRTHLQSPLLQAGAGSAAYVQSAAEIKIRKPEDTAGELLALLLRVLRSLGFTVSPSALAEDLLKFQAAFIMPSDLYAETALDHIGELINAQ